MFIIAKVNKWGEFVLLDSAVHADRQAADDHLSEKVSQIGELVAATYRIYALSEPGGES